MTKQKIFDTVAIHLLTQNAKSTETIPHIDPSSNPTVNCRYRGQDGRMCAIGCLIPDDYYDISIEGGNVESWRVQEILQSMDLLNHKIILFQLQRVHDHNDVILWRSKLKGVAKDNLLNSDCLDKDYDKAGNI